MHNNFKEAGANPNMSWDQNLYLTVWIDITLEGVTDLAIGSQDSEISNL